MNLQKLLDKSFALVDLPTGRNKHFSFLLRRNKIVSLGWNTMNKTHPLAIKHGFTYGFIHSELHAIKNFPHTVVELERCTLVNTRVTAAGRVFIAKPCPCCQKMIMAFGLKEVLYTTNTGGFEKLW